MRVLAIFIAALVALIGGCGGGGGGGGSSSTGTTPPPPVPNAVAIVVDGGPPGLPFLNPDVAFASVTVCAPGTNNCQTIDHIAVDTGSSGLRLAQGVLNASVANALTPQSDASGNPLAECTHFADGTLFWGWVRIADVNMAGEQALSTPIHVLGDPSLPVLPSGCAGKLTSAVADLGANGILGVGNFIQDCGDFCSSVPSNGLYYTCPASGCVRTAVPLTQQVLHPVARFARDNNGVLIQLPAVSATGAASPTGLLIFGIGTQANNALGTARAFTLDSLGNFSILNGSTTYIDSFVDSGSNVDWIPSSINNQLCPSTSNAAGFLCPSPPLNLSLTVIGQNGNSAAVPVNVANAAALFTTGGLTAFNNIGGPNSDPSGVALGLPFFFGRNVFTAIEGATTPAGTGPYVAF
ncbi:MAG TPA: DUF3443 domain-containing protein [Burkholderiales bacterium]|nr:DUF3443 domain-containing protein [Burkholderiales bacterium]